MNFKNPYTHNTQFLLTFNVQEQLRITEEFFKNKPNEN